MGMGATWGPDRLLYRAIAISLALHLAIALFFPALVSIQDDGPSIQTISFVRAIHISVLPAHPVAHPKAAVAIERAPVTAVVIPPRPTSGVHHQDRRLTRGRASHAPIVGIVQHKGSAVAGIEATAPPAAVTATPAPATVASSETRENMGGYMPLGAQEQNPVLDPAVTTSLQALGAHTTLTVDVDADGKTKNVTFKPEIDVNLEARIRSLLANARWDPAICGAGVTCEGRMTIRL